MKSIFDKYTKKYDAWYDKNKLAFLSEVEAIKKVLPKNGKGLEIGVGTGRFARELGIEYGIDPSSKMLALAKRRGINIKKANGEKLPYSDGLFDYVAIIITFCFVKIPIKVLLEAKRVLKEKGKIIIGIVDKESFLGKHYKKKKSVFYEHAKFYSVKEMKTFMERAGFKKYLFYQTLFSFPEEINHIQKPHKGFGKGGFVVIKGERS